MTGEGWRYLSVDATKAKTDRAIAIGPCGARMTRDLYDPPGVPVSRGHNTLDDKIELNRRMNETLEAIAQVIFKSWFMDFDPMRAKAARGPSVGLDAESMQLFTDQLVESELGAIPADWRMGSILEASTLISGGTPRTSEASYWGGGIPWASAKDVSQ